MTVEPMTDADPNMIDLRRFLAEHVGRQGSFRLDVAEGAALIARLDAERTRADAAEAERDAAVARAMPEPRLMRTVEEVEALPAGDYLICSRLNRTRFFCTALALCDERWEVGARFWPDRTMVGCYLSGPLPDLPTPTAAQEG